MTNEEALVIVESCKGWYGAPDIMYSQASKIGQEITELLSAKRKALTEAYKTLSNEK